MSSKNKLLVIGLDCATPQLVFDAFRKDLPVLSSLMERGLYADMRSCHPPITVPAWAVMTSGKDPGALGVYGFRNRADYSYDNLVYADATRIRENRVWDILSQADRPVVLLGVPQTYPLRWIRGAAVSGFLAPDTNCNYTFPVTLKREIKDVVGDYVIDVKDFRTDDKQRLIDQVRHMTDQRFALARHFVQNRAWDFFMMVDMGPDRLHHGLWSHWDTTHHKHDPASPFKDALPDYYRLLDKRIGELLETIDPATTTVMVVSDHGAKPMRGGICINEWLIQEGYLSLKSKPDGAVKLEQCKIDWGNTKAWASGGYYGRLFLNMQGREPRGIIPKEKYHEVRDELVHRIEAIPDEKGNPILTRAHKHEDLYPRARNVPPDLLIYFGDLEWRSVGSVGLNTIYTFENDTGPDDANHAQHGILILAGPDVPAQGRAPVVDIMDIAPTMLKILGEPAAPDMRGKPFI